MLVFVCSVIVFVLVMVAMAVGVLAGRPPIKGSCGGIGALGIDQACDICGGDPVRCDEGTRQSKSSRGVSLFTPDKR